MKENEAGFKKTMVNNYHLPDAEVSFIDGFFSEAQANHLFEQLIGTTSWQQDTITIYGKKHLVPRLTAWYGDADKPYAYSGIKMNPEPWTITLNEIKQKVEAEAATKFTSVLLNYYRSGQDSMGWHRDNEKELGEKIGNFH